MNLLRIIRMNDLMNDLICDLISWCMDERMRDWEGYALVRKNAPICAIAIGRLISAVTDWSSACLALPCVG